MKSFLEEYGFAILTAIVVILLVVMVTPVGNTINASVLGVIKSFGNKTIAKIDETKKEELTNPYTDIVANVQKLYDVGEANLTDDDIITVNGIECYVLQADATKAQLITKDIYNVRFDTGGHISAEVEGHVGTHASYTDKTYDYKYSTLRTWMNDFYVNKLGADSRILPTTVTYYTKDTHDIVLDNYTVGTIANQYVFALDAKEAKQYETKFRWNNSNKQINDNGSLSNNYSHYFWVTAGFHLSNGFSDGWFVRYDGGLYCSNVGVTNVGARPVFWISLE